jgi:hypothetical protein
MNSGCVVTEENGDNIITSSEKAKELEKAGKLSSPYKKTSERRQNVEKIVNDIFKRLRKENK